MPLPAAAFFDMDGLLIDSEPTWFQAEVNLAATWGFAMGPEHYPNMLGKPLAVSSAYIKDVCGGPLTRDEIATGVELAMIDRLRDGVPMLPGAKELLVELAAAGVPIALVSASSRLIVDASLTAIGAEHFRFTVSADDVENGKPNPDPYLKAAALMGADPADCLVLEDSPTGVAAAKAAGCRIIAVPHASPIEAGPRVTVVKSLTEVSVESIRALFA